MGTLQRIKEFIDFKGIKVKHFEEMIGISNGAFASQLKNNKTIGVDKLEKILFIFPELSIEWLLTGEGSMQKKTDKKLANQSVTGNNNAIVGSNVGGNGNTIQHSILPDTVVEGSKEYIEIIKKQQDQIDKLIDVINKISN